MVEEGPKDRSLKGGEDDGVERDEERRLTAGTIDIGSLTIRILVLSGRVTDIVTILSATDKTLVSVDLFWLNGVMLEKKEKSARKLTRSVGDAKCFEARGVAG